MAIRTTIPDIPSLKNFIGKPLGESDWYTISQQQINDFAKATGDHQWIHVDVERAERESPSGGTIAHGYLTLALIPALLPQVLRVAHVSRIVNYGIDKLRLPSPVPAGSRVKLTAEIRSVRSVAGGAARVTISLLFHAEGAKKPCCKGDAIYVYFP